MTKTILDQVENVLGKPVAAQFVEDALKVRRNLLLASFAVLSIVLGNVRVTDTVSVMGLQLSGVTTLKLDIGLLVLLCYLWLHFGWYFWDSILEWRLRITGMRSIVPNTWADEAQDISPDPRQSTLYNWWRNKAAVFQELESAAKGLSTAATTLQSAVTDRYDSREQEIQAIRTRVDEMIGVSMQAHDAIRRWETNTPLERITVSLERFDSWFRLFLTSQSLRWVFVDATMPLLLGIAAIGALLHRICSQV